MLKNFKCMKTVKLLINDTKFLLIDYMLVKKIIVNDDSNPLKTIETLMVEKIWHPGFSIVGKMREILLDN